MLKQNFDEDAIEKQESYKWSKWSKQNKNPVEDEEHSEWQS